MARDKRGRRRWGAFLLFAVAGLLVAAAVSALWSRASSVLEPPRVLGPPALVDGGGEPRLWLLVRQVERTPTGRTSATRFLHHFELRAHDARTAEPRWTRRLLTLRELDGGHSASGRILGPDGDLVWLFLHNQPLAVSAADGAVRADRTRLEQATPALRGLLPASLDFYAFDRGLVITTGDARRVRVAAPDLAAAAYAPASEEAFRRLAFMAQRWNGGYQTRDFVVRHAAAGGRWIGLYTDKEAADAADDGFGDKLKDPSQVLDEGALARRSFWEARIGQTRAFSEGRHDRIAELARLSGGGEFLQGGFLVRAGQRQALALTDPDGVLLLHRTRADDEGRLALSRLDRDSREVWRAALPIAELRNRWEWPDRLLLAGTVPVAHRGATETHELLVAVSLSDGAVRAWSLTRERDALAP